jgi:hypothetical protein
MDPPIWYWRFSLFLNQRPRLAGYLFGRFQSLQLIRKQIVCCRFLGAALGIPKTISDFAAFFNPILPITKNHCFQNKKFLLFLRFIQTRNGKKNHGTHQQRSKPDRDTPKRDAFHHRH